ncbi:MAG: hypothetical protein V7751_19860 [Pseudoalteromonas distincta]
MYLMYTTTKSDEYEDWTDFGSMTVMPRLSFITDSYGLGGEGTKEEGTSRGILIDGLDELLAQLELDAARKPHRIHHFDLIVPDQFNGASVRKLVALRGIEVETWQIGGRSCCGVKCETRDDKTYHFLPLPGSDAEITSATSWPHKSS